MTITQAINAIRTAVFGKEVREALADAVEQCYYRDGNLNVLGMNAADGETGLIITIGGTTSA